MPTKLGMHAYLTNLYLHEFLLSRFYSIFWSHELQRKGNSKENGKEQISKTKVAKLTNLVHTSVVLVNYN